MKYAIVSSAELAAQPGAPLTADYWVNRLDDETYEEYKRRRWITVFLHDAIADPITAEPPDTLNGGDHDR